MIRVTRLNKSSFVINAEWIETIEATPDTVIVLVNGKRFVVTESVDEIIRRVVEYKKTAGFFAKNPFPVPENADIDTETQAPMP